MQWAARQSGGGEDSGYTVAVDSSGNVYVAGYYSSGLTLYNYDGTAFATTLPISGIVNGFVAKYNSAGVVQWAARQSGGGAAYGYGVAVDSSGNVYVSGYYTSSPLTLYNYDGTAFATTLPNSGAIYSFVAKYNSAGVVQWAARQGGGGSDIGLRVAVDSSNVYVVGYYTSSPLTLYNAAGTAFATTLSNSGGNDNFVAKYNSAGVVQWAARQGGGGSDVAFGVAVDSSGNVYVAGYYGSGGLTLYNA